MKKKWMVFALVLMIVLALFMTACEDKNQPEENADPQQEQTVDPGTNPGGNVNPGTEPGGNPSVDPGGNPNVGPGGGGEGEGAGGNEGEGEGGGVDEDVDEPYPEISREDAEKKFTAQFTSFVNGENAIVNSFVNLYNKVVHTFGNQKEGRKEVMIASMTQYFLESGISPYAIDRLLEDLQPIYDLFNAPETPNESTPANRAPKILSADKESTVAAITSAKTAVDILLVPGNLDIVLNSAKKFIKHLPLEGLLKLGGANLTGIHKSYHTVYGDLTEQEFAEYFGENSAKILSLLDFDNSVAQQFAQKDCVKGFFTEILGAANAVVTGNKTEITNVLTSSSAALDYLSKMDWSFLDKSGKKAYNAAPANAPSSSKSGGPMALVSVLATVIPDVTDVSLLNELGKIVSSVATYLGTTDFEADLQQTMTYNSAYEAHEVFDTDLTGLVSVINAIGSVLKNVTLDFIKLNYADAMTFISVMQDEDADEEDEEAATYAACRVYIRVSGLLRPIYAQLDDNFKAKIEAEVAPYFVGAEDEDKNPIVITLASMLDALGTKPLYDDLSEEEIEKLTDEDQDKYIHQEEAALYFMTSFGNFNRDDDDDDDFVPGLKPKSNGSVFNYVLLPLNVTEKADIADALMKARIELVHHIRDGVTGVVVTYNNFGNSNLLLWNELGEDWSFAVDTSKPGFTKLTVTYHVDDTTEYSYELDAYIVAANHENVFLDYYLDDYAHQYHFKQNEDIVASGDHYSADAMVGIYDKETLMYLGCFSHRYTSGNVLPDISKVVDLTEKGIRGAYFTYDDPLFGELYYFFLYRVYDPDNMEITDISLDLPSEIEVDDDYFYAYISIEKEEFYYINISYCIEEGESGEVVVEDPDFEDYTLDRFSISGFSFTHEVGEQEVTITFDGVSYTAIIKIVEEIDDDDDDHAQ